MEKVHFDRRFMYGLYLYIRQMDLSTDRAWGDDWPKLAQFYSGRIPVDSVLAKLLGVAGLNVADCTNDTIIVPKRSIWAILLNRLLRQGGSSYLTKDELRNVCGRLRTFADYLRFASPPRADLVRLRTDLCLAEKLIARRLLIGPDFQNAPIEHFNQNPILRCRPLEDIIGQSWPD